MMRSMTGFGKGEAVTADGSLLSVEISSVNRKQLELRLNLPPELSGCEPRLRQRLGGAISRGAVSLRVSRSVTPGAVGAMKIDDALLENLAEKCMALRCKFGLDPDFNVASLFAVPGVVTAAAVDADSPGLAAALDAATAAALAGFDAMREREGEALRADLAGRLASLRSLLAEIRPHAAAIAGMLRQKLLDRLQEENLPVDPHDERFLREVLFYTDRADVTEELTRLESHFVQFEGFLDREAPVGRSLDFLMQEMFREITTLSNKAGSTAVSPLAVAFKTELEKIREQVQNIE